MKSPYVTHPPLREFCWVNRPIRRKDEMAALGLQHRTFYSELHDTMVGVTIYLPPEYDAARKYPVIYYLHGGGCCESIEYSVRHAVHLGNLIKAGRCPPVIHVFPNGGRGTGYADFHDGSVQIESCIVNELVPWVRSEFAVAEGKCGVQGMSMGGSGAFLLAMKHPDVFGSAISMAGVLSDLLNPRRTPQSVNHENQGAKFHRVYGTDANYIRQYNLPDIAAQNRDWILAEGLRLWIVVGDRDSGSPSPLYGGVRVAEDFKDRLDQLHVPCQYLKMPGVRHDYDHYLPMLEQFVHFHLGT